IAITAADCAISRIRAGLARSVWAARAAARLAEAGELVVGIRDAVEPRALAPVIERDIGRRADEIAAVIGDLRAAQHAVHAQKGLLHQIVGDRGIAHDPADEAKQPAALGHEDRYELCGLRTHSTPPVPDPSARPANYRLREIPLQSE